MSEPLADILQDEGWEPDSNVCASCGHRGGEHDLGNWCLTCPRPETPPTFSGRIEAGWCYFSSHSEAELWASAVKRLIARLDAAGWRLARKDSLALLGRVAEIALTPDGSHTLIDGYCPDCQGGCLRFDPEPVPFVEPNPFYRPDSVTDRRAARRCSKCHRVLGNCICVPKVTSA